MNITSAPIVRFLLVLVALPLLAHGKGGDGIITLKGTIQEAVANEASITFAFSGKLSFSFFTAARDDPARRQIDLEFDVRRLPVRVPKFGTGEYDAEDNPYRVTFKNAAKHAVEASQSGERVTVALFTPSLAFNVNGVIERAEGSVAQILSERVERDFSKWSAEKAPELK